MKQVIFMCYNLAKKRLSPCFCFLECPKGTFKNESANTVCTACPEHSTTKDEGSVSFRDCECDSGYNKKGNLCSRKYNFSSILCTVYLNKSLCRRHEEWARICNIHWGTFIPMFLFSRISYFLFFFQYWVFLN